MDISIFFLGVTVTEKHKCSKCGRKAIYHRRYAGTYLCKKHFNEMLEDKVKKTMRKYDMVEPKETIAVGLSGGKDSVVLLTLLNKISEESLPLDLRPIIIDEGIKGYRDNSIDMAKQTAKDLGLNPIVKSFKEEIGYTLDEITDLKNEDNMKACSYCGVFRRKLLNKVSKEIEADRVAVGHNLDDKAQVIIMNMMRGDVSRLGRIGPTYEKIHDGFIPRIKPLREIPEKETTIYALQNNLDIHLEECPYAHESFRSEIRDFINQTEETHPGTKHTILKAFEKMYPLLSKEFADVELNKCKRCGEPTSNQICQACQMEQQIKEMEKKEQKQNKNQNEEKTKQTQS